MLKMFKNSHPERSEGSRKILRFAQDDKCYENSIRGTGDWGRMAGSGQFFGHEIAEISL